MQNQKLISLENAINKYYDVDLKSKSRDFATLEARDMFIHIASYGNEQTTVSRLMTYLGKSEPAIKKSRSRGMWLSHNDKFFKLRLTDVKNIFYNAVS